jgi:hypothetical protein
LQWDVLDYKEDRPPFRDNAWLLHLLRTQFDSCGSLKDLLHHVQQSPLTRWRNKGTARGLLYTNCVQDVWAWEGQQAFLQWAARDAGGIVPMMLDVVAACHMLVGWRMLDAGQDARAFFGALGARWGLPDCRDLFEADLFPGVDALIRLYRGEDESLQPAALAVLHKYFLPRLDVMLGCPDSAMLTMTMLLGVVVPYSEVAEVPVRADILRGLHSFDHVLFHAAWASYLDGELSEGIPDFEQNAETLWQRASLPAECHEPFSPRNFEY